MKKLGLALTALAIASLIIFILMVSSPVEDGRPGQRMPSPDTIDEYGIWDRQKADALEAALSEPSIDRANYEVDGVSVVEPEDAGFLNVSSHLIKVRLHYVLAGLESVQFDVYVNPDTNSTMAVSYYGVPPGPYDWAMVPPGASWSHTTRAWNTRQSGNSSQPGVVVPELHPAFIVEPPNATVYLTIVDEDNFTKAKNGLPYEAAVFIDPSTNISMKIKDLPVKGRWNATLTLPAIKEEYEYGTLIIKTVRIGTYYLLLNNGRDYGPVKITYAMPGHM